MLWSLLFTLLAAVAAWRWWVGRRRRWRQPLCLSSRDWVVVTGASSGLGARMAIQLSNQYDCKVILCGKDRDGLQRVAAQCYSSTKILVHDLRDIGAAKQLYDGAVGTGERIRAVVLNAGVTEFTEHLRLDHAAGSELMRINVDANVELITLFHRHMMQRTGAGAIMIVSSFSSIFPLPYQALYSGSKGFLTQFGLALDEECRDARDDVSITVFLPPGLATPMSSAKTRLMDYFGQTPFMFLNADAAAHDALHAMVRRKAYRIPTFTYRLGAACLHTLLPSSLVRWSMARQYRTAWRALNPMKVLIIGGKGPIARVFAAHLGERATLLVRQENDAASFEYQRHRMMRYPLVQQAAHHHVTTKVTDYGAFDAIILAVATDRLPDLLAEMDGKVPSTTAIVAVAPGCDAVPEWRSSEASNRISLGLPVIAWETCSTNTTHCALLAPLLLSGPRRDLCERLACTLRHCGIACSVVGSVAQEVDASARFLDLMALHLQYGKPPLRDAHTWKRLCTAWSELLRDHCVLRTLLRYLPTEPVRWAALLILSIARFIYGVDLERFFLQHYGKFHRNRGCSQNVLHVKHYVACAERAGYQCLEARTLLTRCS